MSLRSFCLRIFQHCPLLASFSVENHMRAFEEFLQYKTRVPVRGAILLNEDMDSTVLVKGWKKGANWSFPRGKINKDEDDLDCAIREVYEETGFNIKEAGLVPRDDEVKYIEISMRDQQIRLYVFRNIPMDTVFQPKTRKEISAIEWYKLSELPAFRKKGNRLEDAAAATNANKFYMVAPFLVPLKKWVVQQKKKDGARGVNHAHLAVHHPIEEGFTEDDIGTQTDGQFAPGAQDRIPAIETLEGATRELQRLLKVQPQTQGVQMSPTTAGNPDKGGALMAILKRPSENAPTAQTQQPQPARQAQQAQHIQQAEPFQNQVPHTPLDHIYTNPPEPNTPHYHHATHRLPVHNHQPPPNYHYAAARGRGAPQQQHFNYPLSHLHGHPQGRVPSHSPGMNMGYQNPQFRKEPVLLHPQPLPPQVQQSILTRGIMPTPNLPDAAGQSSAQAHQASLLQAFVTQKPVPLQSQPQQANVPSQMNSHKMSLLNAFKTDNRENSAAVDTPRNNGLQSNTHATQATTQGRASSSGRANIGALQAENPAARYLPQNATIAIPQKPADAAPRAVAPTAPVASMPKPGQSTDQHRTSLLDMFKKAVPMSPPSSTSTVVPSQPMDNPIFAKTQRSNNAAYNRSSSESNNGIALQKNAEASIPYRPVQILARPKQGEASQGRRSVSRSPAQHGSQQQVNLPSPRVQSSLHIADNLRASINNSQSSPKPYHPAPASGSPYGSFAQPQTSALGAPPATQQPRRQDSNPEQRQKLLSLFGKTVQQEQQARGTSASSGYEDKVAGKMKESIAYDQVRSGTPRSRVASLASSSVAVGGGGGIAMEKVPSIGGGSKPSSRRGSQTPISPADRNFLLSYLQNVSSAGR